MTMITLKPGREKTLRRHHPWVFSGAIQAVENDLPAGATVEILSASGEWLARGAWSGQSQIRIRVWTYRQDEKIDAEFFRRRFKQALEYRQSFTRVTDSAWRLVNAESDGLPGLIVDRYADYLVCQFLAAGSEHHKQVIVDELNNLLSPSGIYERSDVDVRKKEGLPLTKGCLSGSDPPDLVPVKQGSLHFLVDVRQGHKTGMYLDQHYNREIVSEFSGGRDVLNCFAHTGNFALAALQAGASHVTNIESSAAAIALIEKQAALNGIGGDSLSNIQGDVFHVLRQYRDAGRQFDMVILDPPRFVSSARDLKRGCRGYKDINMQAIKLLRRGGVLATFSCSGHVSPDLFQKVVADAALDAGCEMKIERYLAQADDHPVALHFPEGRYLKGLICRL